MEIYIIIILIIFILFLNYIDELKFIYKLKYYKYDKINNITIFDTIFLLYTNPVILKLYKNIFISLKKINKYDYKSYFTYLENNNLIEMFYSEKVKFYCEKETKVSIQKLVTSQLHKQDNAISIKTPLEKTN